MDFLLDPDEGPPDPESSLKEPPPPSEREESPEENASFISRLLFLWLQPTLISGYRSPLDFTNVPSIGVDDTALVVTEDLSAAWDHQVSETDSPWALAWAIWEAYKWDILRGVFPSLVQIVGTLTPPFITAMLLDFLANRETRDLSEGIGLALLGVTLKCCEVFGFNSQVYVYDRAALRVHAGLCQLVYRKSLRVSSVSTGNASNLLTVDPSAISGAMAFISLLWTSPLIILGSLVPLFVWLGPSAFVAIGVIMLMLPFNLWVMKKLDLSESKIMELKDERIRSLTEVLSGINIIKLFSWEDEMTERISKIREDEVSWLKYYQYFLAGLNCNIFIFTNVISVATLTVYALLGHPLDAQIIFPSLILFNMIVWPVLHFPEAVSRFTLAYVSAKRLNAFLRKEELPFVDRVKSRSPYLRIESGTFHHPAMDALITEDGEFEEIPSTHSDSDVVPLLKEFRDDSSSSSSSSDSSTSKSTQSGKEFSLDVQGFSVKKGELVAVIGRVGAGKTSLLKALLGELKTTDAVQSTKGSVSLVSQTAWIRNATVRDNILFGLPYNKKRYKLVVKCCALQEDFDMFPASDLTEIGEKGVNLSGGQKQRVNLARGVYADNDIILLDDPLSAVDSHVGQHLFKKCIKKQLANKAVVFVTHQLQYLSEVDRIYVMEKGHIQQQGTFTEISRSGFDFASLVEEEEGSNSLSLNLSADSIGDESSISLRDSTASLRSSAILLRETSVIPHKPNPLAESSISVHDGKLIEEEEQLTGTVDSKVYAYYFLGVKYSGIVWVFLTLFSLSQHLSENAQSRWVGVWSDGRDPDPGLSYFLGIYILWGGLFIVSSVLKQFLWVRLSLDSACQMHNRLLASVLRAPSSFFHTTPTGRILNRFSKDQAAVDQDLPDQVADFSRCIINSCFILILVGVTIPWFFICVVPLASGYYFLMQFYRLSSREFARLVSISFSPIYSQYEETITGLDAIRAYGAQNRLIRESAALLDVYSGCKLSLRAAVKWLSVRLGLMGGLLYLSVAILALVVPGLTPGAAGFILLLITNFSGELEWGIRCGTDVEAKMNKVERILHFTNVESEGELIIEDHRPPSNWPKHGAIEFDNISLRYRPGQDPVLKQVTMKVAAAEKVGIVGRTGAGKSSLTKVLFRLDEPFEGTVKIDGRDIYQYGLRDIRSRLAIIPQDPVLFSGTIRSNLDPFSKHSDMVLWNMLKRVHLAAYIQGLPLKLEAVVSDNGSNFSLGQRQLLCIGRAIVNNSRILVMDEATASVDTETDALIQQTVREEFKDRTVLTIAHRLNTIMDSDKIAVMDAGKLVEFDTPEKLLANPNSFFSSLVRDTGEKSAEALFAIVKKTKNEKDQQPLLL